MKIVDQLIQKQLQLESRLITQYKEFSVNRATNSLQLSASTYLEGKFYCILHIPLLLLDPFEHHLQR